MNSPPPERRLITVSNRLPVTISIEDGQVSVRRSSGGLATGLRQFHGGDSNAIWIGWPGIAGGLSPDLEAKVKQQLVAIGACPVHLSAEEVSVFYEEISNAVLWPLVHDRIDRLPLRISGWDVYEVVNRRYAEAVAAQWRPGDLVWVHDYQLLRVPMLLRRLIPEARIGFFLHVPFPNPEIFFTLPVRRWLVEGMLGADLIGFHTRRYRGHFTGVVRRLFGIEMDATISTFEYDGHRGSLGIFPMGIDAKNFSERAESLEVAEAAAELRESSSRLIVGIDRLDYSKGIERRLLAVEQFFLKYPEWRERVRLIQVAVPSRGRVRAYRRFRDDVESLVGRINGELGTPTWSPIHYIHRSVSPTMLVALYRAADVMLVTPLRDGMNLVAKEFAASRNDEDGVLVLSEFAGAVDELSDAYIVNPYDVDGVADTIHSALTMDRAERRDRMHRLRERVFGHDVHKWAREFLDALSQV